MPQFSKRKLVNIKSKIDKINNYEFISIANIGKDLSGIPVFLENSTDVLGVHKGDKKTEKYCDFIYPLIDIIKDGIYKRRNNGNI